MQELKPCPFCGCSYLMICDTDFQAKRAYCVTCRTPQCHGGVFELAMGEFSSREAAIKAWNTRA